MKKHLHDERELKIFASLLAIGGVLIAMFTVYFAAFGSDAYTDLPPEVPHITIVSTENTPKTPPVTASYTGYAANHKWESRDLVSTWEKNDFLAIGGWDNKCFIATTSSMVYVSAGKFQELSYNYAQCPHNSPAFFPAVDGSHVYVNWNSEISTGGYDNGTPAFRFWVLSEDESPEYFIQGLIQSLSSPVQRDHCVLNSKKETDARIPKGTLPHFTISPDSAYVKMTAEKGQESYGLCYPYNNYFQKVGNILVYIENYQDVSAFDPDSMKVSKPIVNPATSAY